MAVRHWNADRQTSRDPRAQKAESGYSSQVFEDKNGVLEVVQHPQADGETISAVKRKLIVHVCLANANAGVKPPVQGPHPMHIVLVRRRMVGASYAATQRFKKNPISPSPQPMSSILSSRADSITYPSGSPIKASRCRTFDNESYGYHSKSTESALFLCPSRIVLNCSADSAKLFTRSSPFRK